MATKEPELYVLNYRDISLEEYSDLLNSIDDRFLLMPVQKMPPKISQHFEDFKGFRNETMPISRIKSSVLKGIKRNDDIVFLYLSKLLSGFIASTNVKDWIEEYKKTNDIKALYDKFKGDITKGGLKVQPLTWVKLIVMDHSQIPADYCLEIDLSSLENSEPVTVPLPDPKPKVKKATAPAKNDAKEKKQLEKYQEKFDKLKDDIERLKLTHKNELEEERKKHENVYGKFILNVKSKLARIYPIELEAELSTILADSSIDTFEKLYIALSKLEYELISKSDHQVNIKQLEKIIVIKFALLAGKESI